MHWIGATWLRCVLRITRKSLPNDFGVWWHWPADRFSCCNSLPVFLSLVELLWINIVSGVNKRESPSDCFCWNHWKVDIKDSNKLQIKKTLKESPFMVVQETRCLFYLVEERGHVFCSASLCLSYWFCRASAGEPPVMRKPTHDLLCGEEDFSLWLTLCFLCPLSLSVPLFFNSLVFVYWWTHTRTHMVDGGSWQWWELALHAFATISIFRLNHSNRWHL